MVNLNQVSFYVINLRIRYAKPGTQINTKIQTLSTANSSKGLLPACAITAAEPPWKGCDKGLWLNCRKFGATRGEAPNGIDMCTLLFRLRSHGSLHRSPGVWLKSNLLLTVFLSSCQVLLSTACTRNEKSVAGVRIDTKRSTQFVIKRLTSSAMFFWRAKSMRWLAEMWEFAGSLNKTFTKNNNFMVNFNDKRKKERKRKEK